MRYKWVLTTILLAAVAHAKEPQRYETGELLQMDSVECGVDENSGKSFAGEVLGTDSAHKKTHALLCQEYLLQTDHVIYRIRPRNLQSAANIRVAPKDRGRHVEMDSQR